MTPFRTTRKVEFADTDMEGIVHFARYLVYMETAEHELLRAAGTRVAGSGLVWPRVKIECEYLAPLRFGDAVEIEVTVVKLGRSSVTWEHVLRRLATPDGSPAEAKVVARGHVTAVCCQRQEDGDGLRPVPVPERLAAALRPDTGTTGTGPG